jgi:uncharacterized protein
MTVSLPARFQLQRRPLANAMRFSIALTLTLTVLLAACSGDPSNSTPSPNATPDEAAIPFRKDGTLSFTRDGEELVAIDIEIADTDSSRTRGLMQRESLPARSGMLFVFEAERPQGFWMANTPIALDLFFVNADSQIVNIARYTRPFSPETVLSEDPARYVIETPAGFADTYGIIETDRVTWRRDL